MKKIMCVLFFVLSVFSFGASYAPYLNQRNNPNANKMVFTGMVDTQRKKIVSIYQEGRNLVYTFGKEGKADIVIKGVSGQNLFYNFSRFGGGVNANFIRFESNGYSYVLSYFEGVTYRLSAYDRRYKEVFNKEFMNASIWDNLLLGYGNRYNLPEDYEDFYMMF